MVDVFKTRRGWVIKKDYCGKALYLLKVNSYKECKYTMVSDYAYARAYKSKAKAYDVVARLRLS